MANIIVFDTETTSLDKTFCYDVGYTIINSENGITLKEEHFVIEQNWHNLPLFESAYYKEKRPLYVSLMRTRKASLVKWGYMTQTMIRDIKNYGVTDAYAYNSSFDEKVFNFNCDWFKTINPFDNVAIHDIREHAFKYIVSTNEYKNFCEEHKLFTEAGNYSTTAETVYKFITKDPNFVEQHMGLMDSQIESRILMYCLSLNGGELNANYKGSFKAERKHKTPFIIKINGKQLYKGEYVKKYNRNETLYFTVEEG